MGISPRWLAAVVLAIGACGGDDGSEPVDSAPPSGDAPIDAPAVVDPCAGGTADTRPASSVSGDGFVELDTATTNPILSLTTTLTVPPKPAQTGTLFLWPGIQPLPGGTNYTPIDNGVLQPVLTWGPTCAPNAPASPYASWWVSSQYVNTVGSAPGFTGCQGGTGIDVSVGDKLKMDMVLSGTTWTQTVTSMATGATATYSIDLHGQSQHRALFVIEPYDGATATTPIQFDDTVVTFADAAAASCHVLRRGTNDEVSAPVASADGTKCCIASLTLAGQ